MPAPRPTHPKIGVLADPDAVDGFDASIWEHPPYLLRDGDEQLAATLGRYLDARCDVVAVVGGDAFLGEVVTAYQRRFRKHPAPLRLFVMRCGKPDTVAQGMGAPELSVRSFRRLASAVNEGQLNRRLLRTLKVTSSARAAAQFGFSFGAGLLFGIFEAMQRSQPSRFGALPAVVARLTHEAVVGGGGSLQPVPGRVAVDSSPVAEQFGYLLASSLQESWFGLKMNERVDISYRMADSSRELAKQLARSRAIPRLLRSARGEGFERIHIDWSAGYVLDGELYQPSKPYVIQLERGPIAHLTTL